MLVLGAGMMGRAAVYDMIHFDSIEQVVIADVDKSRAQSVVNWLKSSKVTSMEADLSDENSVMKLMKGMTSCLSAVPYKFNSFLANCAVRSRVHFCDLGGNNDVVASELALDEEARKNGVTIVPDCGLAPGMVSVLVAHGAKNFSRLDDIKIRVGGLPAHPKPPLNYKLVFSPYGLINEYIEPARLIRNGELKTVSSMTEIEEIEFPPPFGRMEAFHTSGGSSTLTTTFLNRVKNLDYKTIRYPGHCEKFKLFLDLGLGSLETVNVPSGKVVPRDVLAAVCTKWLTDDDTDVVLCRVLITGVLTNGKPGKIAFEMIEAQDPESGLSAMARTTAFPASIVALMMAKGKIEKRGAVPQELCVPTDEFVHELSRRNIKINTINET